MKYIIKDWAGNVLQHAPYAVPRKFNSFEDAWEYLYDKYSHLEDKAFDEEMSEWSVEEYTASNNVSIPKCTCGAKADPHCKAGTINKRESK
jgi:hypothetical protein